MKVWLLYPDRDPPGPAPLSPLAKELVQDLDLPVVFEAMAAGDPEIRRVCEATILESLRDSATVVFRQRALEDCRRAPGTVRQLYAIAAGALDEERRIWGWSERSPASVLTRSSQVLGIFLEALQRLVELARSPGREFRSEAFGRLFAEITSELDEAFFREATRHLERLRERETMLLSAGVGPAATAADLTLRTPNAARGRWWQRVLPARRSRHTVLVSERDEAGHRFLSDLKDRGVAPAAAALGRSADHLLQFLRALRDELGFYVGALNLADRLAASGNPTCLPTVSPRAGAPGDAKGLYDLGLALHTGRPVVANDLPAAGRALVLLTGANRGGKSTLLRAIGLAQLLAQAGLFVGSERCTTGFASGVFTHFRREEDAGMTRGKLEEELARLRAIARTVGRGGLLLCNETLSSTNEREGSAIADGVVRALLERGVTVCYVTFLFEFADTWRREAPETVLCLRADRAADGSRSFRLLPGEPLPTSFAEDLYRKVWGRSEPTSIPAASPR